MAKKNAAPICSRCETPFRRATSFCTSCGSPTPWATHDERVQWEVGQWRASRGRGESDPGQMMLVKTEAGYQPVPYQHHYVWDQPLHPEREQPPEPASRPLASYVSRPTATAVAPQRTPVGEPAPEPPPAAEETAASEPQPASNAPELPVDNGTNGAHAARTATMYIPAPEIVRRPAPAAPAAPAGTAAPPEGSAQQGPAPGGERSNDVRVSRKAIVLGVVLALGLPLGSRALNALRGDPAGVSAPASDGEVPSGLRALPVGTMGSGFVQVGPDAARYAVLVQNLNAVFTARSVAVHVSLLDAAGRPVGAATEWVASLPPNATLGFAGATGVAGPVARVTATIETGSFDRSRTAAGYQVRGVRVARSATEVVVQASVSADTAGRARVVAVHLDEAGRVVGGDFTYADLPKAPKATSVVISTADASQRVVRADVFVLSPR